MIEYGCRICPSCGGALKRYDKCIRYVRVGFGRKVVVVLSRFYCVKCGKIHREMIGRLIPYYRYDRRIIVGFLSGRLNICMDAFEDYPCEGTVRNWQTHKKHLL